MNEVEILNKIMQAFTSVKIAVILYNIQRYIVRIVGQK